MHGSARSLDAQAVEESLVAAPALAHAHVELEVDATFEEALDLLAGSRADGPHHLAPGTHQDALLRFGLRPHPRPHDEQAIALVFLNLVDLDLHRVRHLLTRAEQHLLAHQLGKPQLERLVTCLLRRIEKGALRHERHKLLDHRRDSRSADRADREQLALDVEVGRRGQCLHGARSVEPVDLVQHGHRRHARSLQRVGDEAVPGADLLLAVQHEQRGIGIRERALHLALHSLGERVAGALHARQVHEHELPVVAGGDSTDLASGRLRLVGHDRDLAADDLVHKRRLSRVRPPGEGNEAGAAHSSSSTRRWSESISPSSLSWSYPHRWSTPWTTASFRSSVCSGQITTSPSSRGPAEGPPASTGKESTSVGRSRSRCSRLSARMASASTTCTATWPTSTPAAASAARAGRRNSSGASMRSSSISLS